MVGTFHVIQKDLPTSIICPEYRAYKHDMADLVDQQELEAIEGSMDSVLLFWQRRAKVVSFQLDFTYLSLSVDSRSIECLLINSDEGEKDDACSKIVLWKLCRRFQAIMTSHNFFDIE